MAEEPFSRPRSTSPSSGRETDTERVSRTTGALAGLPVPCPAFPDGGIGRVL